jgi:RecA-family ATPase
VSTVRLHRASDMAESKPVVWRLAPGYLAAGKVNLLVGAEGIGKSLWSIRAVASITTGHPWGPFTSPSDPADAILIATEDGWEDTIRPRLEVASADLHRHPRPVRGPRRHWYTHLP